MIKRRFTTDGPIRGDCGHKHKYLRTAQECLEKDQRGCAKQGGYSDREIVEVTNDCHFDKEEDEENEGRCFNILCEQRWSETCFPNHGIGWPCDCGSTIWHKDEYNNTENKCDVCRDQLTEHCVTDENKKLCHTCWQKKEDLINYGDDV